jgi:Tfp pilus assembly protein PilN
MSVDVRKAPPPGPTFAGPSGSPVGGIRVDWAPVPRVNLLPPEIVAGRRFRRVQRLLGAAVLGTVAVAGFGLAWAWHEVSLAQADLDVSRARTAQLHTEEAKYADVPRLLAQVEQAKQAREQALGRDVAWYRFFDDLAAATPQSVSLSNVSVALDATGSAAAPGADPLTPSGLGTVTFAGAGDRFPDVATWLDSVATIAGLDGSTLTSATRAAGGSQDGPVTFSSKIVIAETALSHRYDGKAR